MNIKKVLIFLLLLNFLIYPVLADNITDNETSAENEWNNVVSNIPGIAVIVFLWYFVTVISSNGQPKKTKLNPMRGYNTVRTKYIRTKRTVGRVRKDYRMVKSDYSKTRETLRRVLRRNKKEVGK